CCGSAPSRSASRATASSYCQVWQYTTCRESSCSSRCGLPASAAATRATVSHMSRGSGAPRSPTSSGCHVCAATPMMHGDLGSIAIATALPRLPHGRPLLGERARAFLGILGLEDAARQLALLLERGAEFA